MRLFLARSEGKHAALQYKREVAGPPEKGPVFAVVFGLVSPAIRFLASRLAPKYHLHVMAPTQAADVFSSTLPKPAGSRGLEISVPPGCRVIVFVGGVTEPMELAVLLNHQLSAVARHPQTIAVAVDLMNPWPLSDAPGLLPSVVGLSMADGRGKIVEVVAGPESYPGAVRFTSQLLLDLGVTPILSVNVPVGPTLVATLYVLPCPTTPPFNCLNSRLIPVA